MKWSACLLGMIAWVLILTPVVRGEDGPSPVVSRALIIVGLSGDSAHETLFRATVRRWKDWLVGPLGFAPNEVRILAGHSVGDDFGDAPATRESIAAEVNALRGKTLARGRVWVFVLGHVNFDEDHVFLHLPGPDIRDVEFAALFRGIEADEQVFWITTPGSGAFLPSLSMPGRIVVAATDSSGEANETEFPHALADVSRKPLSGLDRNKDGKLSVREVFLATVDEIEARFKADKRTPTEHAQLDDNGDGVGTELKADSKATDGDGVLASKVFLPTNSPGQVLKTSIRSEHGTDRVAPAAR